MTGSQGQTTTLLMHRGKRWLPRELRLLLTAGSLVATIAATPLAATVLNLSVPVLAQVPDDPSPASASSQVVAQGVVNIAANDLRWEVAQRTAPPPANATTDASVLGFLVIDSGVVLVEDLATGHQWRLASGEALLTHAGAEQTRAALGSDAAVYREIRLVDAAAEAAAGEEAATFSSEPFAGPGARHDLDLLADALGPGEAMDLPGGALPTLVHIVSGTADVTTEAGDVLSLAGGETLSLAGALNVTAAENGAEVVAVHAGPAVPRLTQAAATPTAVGRVIEAPAAQTTPVAGATPAATIAPEPAAVDVDQDGDGLTNAQEAELNTDPALADTDEDGLNDGQEQLEIGTSPLAPDTDADGVLDGDEVAQGTDPLDGGVAAADPAVVEPAAPVVEEPVPADPAAALDGDGDGLDDAIENELGTDPFDVDTDDDGATDGDEYYVHATGTRNPDSDGDGVLDGDEVANGTDPNDINSF